MVEAAAARGGVHAGLLDVRAAPVVREILNDELGADAERCAADVELLVEAVRTKLAARVTKGPVPPAAFAEYVTRLSAAGSMSDADARWALATWAGAAAGRGTADPELLAVPPPTPLAPRPGLAGSAGPSRRTLLIVAAAVLVVLGALLVVAHTDRSDPETAATPAELELAHRWDGVGGGDPGPFATADAFVAALPVPRTFTRADPDRGSTFATAEFLATTDFDTTCADLARVLQAMEPTFPALVNQEYPTGGVSRCEAEGPITSLGGASTRVLVLKIDNRVQLYVGEPASSPTAVTDPAPTVP